jgi:hypothetical protein
MQSGEDVAVWLRDHGLPGEAMVVFFSQQGLCQFRLDEVEARRARRVHLFEHGAFDVQGFALDEPRGVCLRILIPLPPVVEAAASGVTLMRCRPVIARELSPREEALACRLRHITAPNSRLPPV